MQNVLKTVAAYVFRLRTLTKMCEFGTLEEEMIRDYVVQTCLSARLRRKLLQEAILSLDLVLEIARKLEVSTRQAATIEKE